MGLITLGIGYAALGHVKPFAGLLVAIALGSVGNSVVRPALTSLLSRLVTPQEQGVALGLFQTVATYLFGGEYQQTIAVGLLMVVLLAKPEGLFGSKKVRPV